MVAVGAGLAWRLARSPFGFVLAPVVIGAWLGVGALLALVFARLYFPDRHIVLIWANAFTFWVYLPAYPAAAVALLFRRRYLLIAAAVAAGFHLAWVLPDYRPGDAIPAAAGTAPRLRLMTANVYFGNEDYGPIAREILEADPDLLFVQEFGEKSEEQFAADGIAERLPYRQAAYENAFFGMAIYSRFPLEDVEAIDAAGRPFLRATITVEGIPVRLYHVHPTSPGLGSGIDDKWNAGWEAITTALAAENGHVVVAGDFNMNQHHRWYRRLEALGFINAHEERGRGNATTWPRTRPLVQIRIDHVFHTSLVACLSVREGRGEGSDHRPVIADLALLPV